MIYNSEMQKSTMIKNILQRSKQLLESNQYDFVKDSLNFLRSFMNIEDFGRLYVSFNGGKDATVVLFLTIMAMQDSPIKQRFIKCIYFAEPEPFEEIEKFIAQIRSVSIDWSQMPSKKYQEQLSKFCNARQVKHIVMGSRKGDPHCSALSMQARSDVQKGYPDFQRLNPIVFWSYEQVWTFISDFGIPYCSLYNQGYTYLGNKGNTTKNNNLYDQKQHKYKSALQGCSQIETNSRL